MPTLEQRIEAFLHDLVGDAKEAERIAKTEDLVSLTRLIFAERAAQLWKVIYKLCMELGITAPKTMYGLPINTKFAGAKYEEMTRLCKDLRDQFLDLIRDLRRRAKAPI